MSIVIYTDGACSGNPGPGGWAWAIENGAFRSGFEPRTTNQRMELMAVLDAVRQNEGPVEIVSDSTYVVNCFKDKWHLGWLKRGWVNSKNQPVANRDIWEPLIQIVLARKNVTFRWVKGHSGHVMNDYVDRLAVEATQAGKGSSGSLATATKAPAVIKAPAGTKSPAAIKAVGALKPDASLLTTVSNASVVPSASAVPSPGSWVVIFQAELKPTLPLEYTETAQRMRALAFEQYGCLGFTAVTEVSTEIALSYWPDEASIVRWKSNAEHMLAQQSGRDSWYRSYRVDVASIARSYCWPDRG